MPPTKGATGIPGLTIIKTVQGFSAGARPDFIFQTQTPVLVILVLASRAGPEHFQPRRQAALCLAAAPSAIIQKPLANHAPIFRRRLGRIITLPGLPMVTELRRRIVSLMVSNLLIPAETDSGGIPPLDILAVGVEVLMTIVQRQ